MNELLGKRLAVLLLAMVFSPSPATLSIASPIACGDVDSSGAVTSLDALRVLKEAVGLESGLQCPCGTECPVTTSTVPVGIDECFEDDDCWDDHPGWHCGGANGFTCVECENDDHCASEFTCAGSECVPE
jgi:hypothetical protein